MSREEIISYLGEDWKSVQALMESALHSDISLLNEVNASVMDHGGKRLRPLISMLVARACGTPNEDSVRFAVASELLHNATLIHDDVADNSTERRGNPSVQSSLGATSAVLVGDFWLARSVEVLLGAERQQKVYRLFSKTLSDLAEGEMLQLEKAFSSDTEEEDYYRIIYCKTASLFEAACMSGAISVDAPEEYVKAVSTYARAAGVAFQIKDDILDYAGDEQLGKPVGIDLVEKKITLPLLGILKDSPDSKRIREMVRNIDKDPSACSLIREMVRERGGVEYAAKCLDAYIEAALKALEVLPASQARDYLADLARYNSYRKI